MTVLYIPWAHGTNYSSDLEVVQLPLSIRRVGEEEVGVSRQGVACS